MNKILCSDLLAFYTVAVNSNTHPSVSNNYTCITAVQGSKSSSNRIQYLVFPGLDRLCS